MLIFGLRLETEKNVCFVSSRKVSKSCQMYQYYVFQWYSTCTAAISTTLCKIHSALQMCILWTQCEIRSCWEPLWLALSTWTITGISTFRELVCFLMYFNIWGKKRLTFFVSPLPIPQFWHTHSDTTNCNELHNYREFWKICKSARDTLCSAKFYVWRDRNVTFYHLPQTCSNTEIQINRYHRGL